VSTLAFHKQNPGDIEKTEGGRREDDPHVIDTSASRAEVNEALTTEKGLSAWWSTKVTAGEATVGSVIHFTFVGDFTATWSSPRSSRTP
jgi:hypothetical protein